MHRHVSPLLVIASCIARAAHAQPAAPVSDELPGWVLGAVIGASVSLGLVIHQALQRRRNAGLWERLEPQLRQGPATLPALAAAVGHDGFLARGKVALALQEAVALGKLDVVEAPPGTPQLEKVKHITYRLKGA
ncbi:MAG: hypothetical protein INH37_24055 [Myxococcaceae bacterium]|nr:hypothetical protein [Myxococcaceae bacterium]